MVKLEEKVGELKDNIEVSETGRRHLPESHEAQSVTAPVEPPMPCHDVAIK
uniref:Uncharacterized protein n=1 Tax=Setaria digitata TaxID=48799 RepID=A0A915PRQ3_9BILA